jgi:hypothetical protein
MDAEENKRALWDKTSHIYKPWMERSEMIGLFEQTVQEVNRRTSGTLAEKNQAFIRDYTARVDAMAPRTTEARDAMFEERARARLAAFRNGTPVPKKNVSFADDDPLPDIRRALSEALERLDAYMLSKKSV